MSGQVKGREILQWSSNKTSTPGATSEVMGDENTVVKVQAFRAQAYFLVGPNQMGLVPSSLVQFYNLQRIICG